MGNIGGFVSVVVGLIRFFEGLRVSAPPTSAGLKKESMDLAELFRFNVLEVRSGGLEAYMLESLFLFDISISSNSSRLY